MSIMLRDIFRSQSATGDGSFNPQKEKYDPPLVSFTELERRLKRYSEKDEECRYVTLIVEERRLYVLRDILVTASPVFKAMFAKNNFAEGIEQEASLPDKSIQAMIWMLDYLYPDIKGHDLTDKKAAALLPLACEYQVEALKTDSINELMKLAIPRLEIVTLALKYDLKNLQDAAIKACVTRVHSDTLDKERLAPENHGLPLEIYHQIIREKLRGANGDRSKRNPRL